MGEKARIDESKDELGEVVAETVMRAVENLVGGWDLARVAGDANEVEVEVAIPFRVKVHVRPPDAGQRLPPGTVCCVCTRDSGGTVRCWGSDTACC